MSKSPQKSRLKRQKAKAIKLTKRDANILLALHKYRFLTTEHLMAITDTESQWSMNKRLRLLFDHKYTDRPQAQKALFSHATKRPMVHALGNKGAKLLSERYGIAMPPTVYWTEKNRRVRENHIEHTLGISDFMVNVELVCNQDGNIRIIDRDEILARSAEQTKRAEYPFRWSTQVLSDGKKHNISIVPDFVFGLHYTDKPEGNNRAFFFVEIDRGTMPVVRKDIRQTSFLRKMKSYADTFERKLALDRFGIKNFRVLSVTTSPDRIQTMIEAFQSDLSQRCPAGVFRFAVKTEALGTPYRWVNAKGVLGNVI